VPTTSLLGTPRPLGGAQRARDERESAVRWFRQDPRVPADQVLADYDRWLDRQALAARTRAGYRRWVRELVEHLDAGDELEGFLSRDGEHDRRAVLGDWRRRLIDRGLAPSTVNLALAAATSLLDAQTLVAPRVPRVEVDPAPPRALTPEQLRAVERETDRLRSTRDRGSTDRGNRGGLDRGVSEERADVGDGGAGAQSLRGAGVAQGVRVPQLGGRSAPAPRRLSSSASTAWPQGGGDLRSQRDKLLPGHAVHVGDLEHRVAVGAGGVAPSVAFG